MPYIKPTDKCDIRLTGRQPKTAGEMNYVITTMLIKYFNNHGGNYQAINDVIGALEGAKMEFYRRLAAPYEDVKIKENGDVY